MNTNKPRNPRSPQKKPTVDKLKFLAKCYDDASEYANSVGRDIGTRPFEDRKGEPIDGLFLEVEDATYNAGFRAGIEYALTGNETRGLSDLWRWINAALFHKESLGNVEYIPTIQDQTETKAGILRILWRR